MNFKKLLAIIVVIVVAVIAWQMYQTHLKDACLEESGAWNYKQGECIK